MKLEFRDARIAIETQLAEDLPALVVDRIQIVQVMVNLLKNALEACTDLPYRQAVVTVATRSVTNGVQISVADNGPGIQAREETNIFDPFQTTKPEGIGLGLAISKSIVDRHHGELTYDAETTQGATFTVSLPTESEGARF